MKLFLWILVIVLFSHVLVTARRKKRGGGEWKRFLKELDDLNLNSTVTKLPQQEDNLTSELLYNFTNEENSSNRNNHQKEIEAYFERVNATEIEERLEHLLVVLKERFGLKKMNKFLKWCGNLYSKLSQLYGLQQSKHWNEQKEYRSILVGIAALKILKFNSNPKKGNLVVKLNHFMFLDPVEFISYTGYIEDDENGLNGRGRTLLEINEEYRQELLDQITSRLQEVSAKAPKKTKSPTIVKTKSPTLIPTSSSPTNAKTRSPTKLPISKSPTKIKTRSPRQVPITPSPIPPSSKPTQQTHGVANNDLPFGVLAFRAPAGKSFPRSYDPWSKSWKVKDQGSCGSCWSFATIATIEGALKLQGWDNFFDLSEAQILSETYPSRDSEERCDGGRYENGYNYIASRYLSGQAAGVVTEQAFSYGLGPLLFGLGDPTPSRLIKGIATVKRYLDGKGDTFAYYSLSKIEDIKYALQTQGPVAIAMAAGASCFKSYSSGTLTRDNCDCEDQISHAMTIVGWDVDGENKEYWIVRNSWGDSWGAKGYVHMITSGVCSMQSFTIPANVTSFYPVTNKWLDGVICGAGSTCNKCYNPHSFWDYYSFTACGKQVPCLTDGSVCFAGTSCDSCCNAATTWLRPTLYTGCGTEPCYSDGTDCVLGTNCDKCCSGSSSTWYAPYLRRACGKEPCWSDGTFCTLGSSCNTCCHTSSTWYTPFLRQACGSEPCWEDGKTCAAGTSCNLCCSGSSTWYSPYLRRACGTEPCLNDGSTCVAGTSCGNCCSGTSSTWYSPILHRACGTEPCWSDGRFCTKGSSCDSCCNPAKFWASKGYVACGKDSNCWSDGSVCALGTTCDSCCNNAQYWVKRLAHSCGPPTCSQQSEACDPSGRCCGSGVCRLGFCGPSCFQRGGLCSSSSDCCGSLTCLHGFCQPSCSGRSEGCGGLLPNCCGSDVCRAGFCGPSCLGQGGLCTSSSGCCGSLTCQHGFCQPSCSGRGEGCGGLLPNCCGSDVCRAGFCGPSCSGKGGLCGGSGDCCGSLKCYVFVCG